MPAQARRLFRALFVCLCFFELSLLCALGGGDDGVGSVAPLVDDYLIYCNITHTRIAINDNGGQTLTGELKAEIKVLSAAIRELLYGFSTSSTILSWTPGGLKRSVLGSIGDRAVRANWPGLRGLLERMYGFSWWEAVTGRCNYRVDNFAKLTDLIWSSKRYCDIIIPLCKKVHTCWEARHRLVCRGGFCWCRIVTNVK